MKLSRFFLQFLGEQRYSRALLNEMIGCYARVDADRRELIYSLRRLSDEPYAEFLLACAGAFVDGETESAAVGPRLIKLLQRIDSPSDVVTAVMTVLNAFEVRKTVGGNFLAIAVEAALGAEDQEPLLRSLARCAAFADRGRPSPLLTAAPILSGIGTYYLHGDQRRQCVSVRLKEVWRQSGGPSHNEPLEKRSIANQLEHNWLELSDATLALQFLDDIRHLTHTESRSRLFNVLARYSEEFSLRRYPQLALDAACAIHDCFRWWT